jgi:hypothetical protein
MLSYYETLKNGNTVSVFRIDQNSVSVSEEYFQVPQDSVPYFPGLLAQMLMIADKGETLSREQRLGLRTRQIQQSVQTVFASKEAMNLEPRRATPLRTSLFSRRPDESPLHPVWKLREELLRTIYRLLSVHDKPEKLWPHLAEDESRYGLFHQSRTGYIWNPDHNVQADDLTPESPQFPPDLPEKSRNHLRNWTNEKGLMYHVELSMAGAEAMIQKMQAHFQSLVENKKPLNKWQKAAMEINPQLLALQLGWHDFGRHITHDRDAHGPYQKEVFKKMRLHPDYWDFPKIEEEVLEKNAQNPLQAALECGLQSLFGYYIDVHMKSIPVEEQFEIVGETGTILVPPILPNDMRSVRTESQILSAVEDRMKHYKSGDPEKDEVMKRYYQTEMKLLRDMARWMGAADGLGLPEHFFFRVCEQTVAQYPLIDARMGRQPIETPQPATR